ncbi:hypothetical protein IWQ57_003632 [Coemansia nantahalensis]|uniref:Uncharacterized protein n=1 Tax=Coemansia nantahalensis TaxID=2789366 RepID=A0ACC1JW15_9FUNG|nr:hypothetical protein IWQ57_003632 [Coemansia nantahalensis]
MASADGPLFLGLDLSTQQLKGVVVDGRRCVVDEVSMALDERFPAYGTASGRHVRGDVATAPVLMWVEAIDALMAELAARGLAGRIHGIGGAAQQHGSVYWRACGVEAVGRLDPGQPLKAQLLDAFAVADSPTWEDSSTGPQCRELEQAAGGAAVLARISGSVAFERFTGAQIAKVKQTRPAAWKDTARISLVSSFAASLLVGDVAPVDCGDASGTNIYDVQRQAWSQGLCDAIDPRLVDMLGARVVPADAVVGTLSPYFVRRYGFAPCLVTAFTGDNPSAFAGFESLFAATGHPAAIVSLGTSDTLLFPLDTYPYATDAALSSAMHYRDGHVLQHPTAPGRFIAMLCYKNGSLAREWVRGHCLPAGPAATWADFDKAAGAEPMAPAAFGFYYLSTEILPRASGVHRFVRCTDGPVVCPGGGRYRSVDSFDGTGAGSDARAIIESQALSMRLDFARKSPAMPASVAVTGGAASNPVLVQTLADVLGVSVYAAGVQSPGGFVRKTPAMPAYGGAVRAQQQQRPAGAGGEPELGSGRYELRRICSPCERRHAVYTRALADFEFLRSHVSAQQSGP